MSLKKKSTYNNTISKVERKFKLEIDEKLEKLVDSKCGEIYFKQQGGLFLSCAFCNINFIDLQLFSEHLYKSHPFVNYIQNEEEILKNEILETLSVESYNGKTINGSKNCKIKHYSSESSNSLTKCIKSTSEEIETEEKLDPTTNLTLNETFSQEKVLKTERFIKRAPEGHWKCQVCNLICKKGEEKENHLKTHGNVKRFICESCGKCFDKINKLENHLRYHTGERPFKCEFCPLTFKCRGTLKQHERNHFSTIQLKCSFCESCFKSKNAKLKHEFRHTDNREKKFECDLCGKTFLTLLHMTGHRKRHKFAGKPFQCSQCPKSFQTKYNLTAHERLEHRGEFNYKCDFCDKVFIKICVKRAHELSHTRVGKPFPCDLCEKKYATREGLYKHKKKDHIPNLSQSEYKCDKCGENFENKELFREHCKKHNLEDKKFGCKDCEARFDSEYKLNNHCHRKHI